MSSHAKDLDDIANEAGSDNVDAIAYDLPFIGMSDDYLGKDVPQIGEGRKTQIRNPEKVRLPRFAAADDYGMPVIVPGDYNLCEESSYQADNPNVPYHKRRDEILQDFTNLVPLKEVIWGPETMGGLLGYTVIGENWIAKQRNLRFFLDLEVSIHESIHTPDEYETRVITWWMMQKEVRKYLR